MGEPRERVVLITIRASRVDDGPPMIVTSEHQVWPQVDRQEPRRSTVSAHSEEVVATVRHWLTEFLEN